ncbi:LysR substrate-binding domain-containing protein [Oricola sp.]|uniref:LysR substrate-binding domain-containing protein n=1 Tax=Oricola sp. TaxID=1979950 RepID=UPI0025DB2796|nr:LysR substrate-binding domain-containing protein [Oricola sp.]MCI5077850.1 LysR substrate-binding domain-containing protein [Oricola sp.]
MPNRMPSFKQLRALEAAVRHRSFKRAASELFVTQAAISHQIKALEDTLGLALFVRGTREVRPTGEAESYAERLGEAFALIAAATAEIDRKRMTGRLRLSVAPFYGNRWLLPRLERFRALYPELEIEAALSFDLVDFAASSVDAAVRFGAGDWPGLRCIPIHGDCVGPVCAPKLLAGRAPDLDPAEIAAMPLVTATQWHEDWPTWFEAVGFAPPADLKITSYDNRAFAFDAALSGNGVFLGDIRMTASDEEAGHLVRLHPLMIERPQGIHLVYPETRIRDPRIEALGEWMKAEAAALAVRPRPIEDNAPE